jgi:hypothetical protein
MEEAGEDDDGHRTTTYVVDRARLSTAAELPPLGGRRTTQCVPTVISPAPTRQTLPVTALDDSLLRGPGQGSCSGVLLKYSNAGWSRSSRSDLRYAIALSDVKPTSCLRWRQRLG